MLHKGADSECNVFECRTEIRAPQNQLCLSLPTMVSRGALDKFDRLCPSSWMSDPIVMDRRAAMKANFGWLQPALSKPTHNCHAPQLVASIFYPRFLHWQCMPAKSVLRTLLPTTCMIVAMLANMTIEAWLLRHRQPKSAGYGSGAVLWTCDFGPAGCKIFTFLLKSLHDELW